jgi:GTPase SAR1 family protein
MYYRGANVAMLVFALDDPHSLTDVELWVEEMRSQVDVMPKLYILGNKMDLIVSRRVSTQDGEMVARRVGAEYYETSAKAGSGIDELFWKIADDVCKRGSISGKKVVVTLGTHRKGRKRKGPC